jgi:uncharacterized protein with von Willebrand factor type A (vWA) domain
MIRSLVRGALKRKDVDRADQQRMQSLSEKSFYYLSEDEIRRMQEAVTKLARRLKNVVSIRRKRARRGRFDPSATLRRNLQYGGVPFRVVFDRRRKEKPQVIVLCDVSDSVRNVSRFMLQFVYSLQDLYSKVRSFVFVADVARSRSSSRSARSTRRSRRRSAATSSTSTRTRTSGGRSRRSIATTSRRSTSARRSSCWETGATTTTCRTTGS